MSEYMNTGSDKLFSLEWTWVQLVVDGWIARLSLSVPLVGWLILFNDNAGGALSFSSLGVIESSGWFNSGARLRFIYFGLISLGAANLLYRVFVPKVVSNYKNADAYVAAGLNIFSHEQILNVVNRSGEWRPSDKIGKELDGTSVAFEISSNKVFKKLEHDNRDGTHEYDVVKQRYAPYLRSMLTTYFSKLNKSRRYPMVGSLVFGTIGYLLLLMPSVDVFWQVLVSTLPN